MKKIYRFGFSFLLFLVVLELILRISGIFNTHNESLGGDYNHQFKISDQEWFHTWGIHDTVNYVNQEFTYINIYNDLGHREIDFQIYKEDSSSTKFVFLGDSFTEGDGAPQDSTWTKFFDKKFIKHNSQDYISYNAGVCGSDVFFNYIMLREKLMVAKPAVVIEAINQSDILDVYYYGGIDRFKEDGGIFSPNYLFWEPIYARIHIFRMLVNVFTSYDTNLVKQKTWEEEQQKIIVQIANQINETNRLCSQLGVTYYFAFTPTPYGLHDGYNEYFMRIKELVSPEVKILDVFPCMEGKLNDQNIFIHSWPINGHFNGKGYKLLGDCIYDEFQAVHY